MSDNPLILIVEDDVDMAQLNARLLKRQGFDALLAHTAAEARALFEANNADLCVLDVGLPDGDGHLLCKEFKLKSDAPILFLTGRSETKDKIEGLNTGVDYYLTKPYDSSEFIAVVKNLLRRSEFTRKKFDELKIIVKGSLTLKLDERKAYVHGRDAGLTQKEFAVLLILAQNENKEIASEHIYKSVWGNDMNNDPHPVRLHISRLKKKLDEENAKDFSIFTEYGKGYTFLTYR